MTTGPALLVQDQTPRWVIALLSVVAGTAVLGGTALGVSGVEALPAVLAGATVWGALVPTLDVEPGLTAPAFKETSTSRTMISRIVIGGVVFAGALPAVAAAGVPCMLPALGAGVVTSLASTAEWVFMGLWHKILYGEGRRGAAVAAVLLLARQVVLFAAVMFALAPADVVCSVSDRLLATCAVFLASTGASIYMFAGVYVEVYRDAMGAFACKATGGWPYRATAHSAGTVVACLALAVGCAAAFPPATTAATVVGAGVAPLAALVISDVAVGDVYAAAVKALPPVALGTAFGWVAAGDIAGGVAARVILLHVWLSAAAVWLCARWRQTLITASGHDRTRSVSTRYTASVDVDDGVDMGRPEAVEDSLTLRADMRVVAVPT